MSSATPSLSHRDLAAILRGEADTALRDRLAQLRRDDPRYRLLFVILDDLPPTLSETPSGQDESLFEGAGRFLEAFFGGQADEGMGIAFRSRLVHSPAFYGAVLRILDDVEPDALPAPSPELARQFPRRRTAEDFLRNTIMPEYHEQAADRPAMTRIPVSNQPSFLDRLVDLLRSPAPAYAMAAALALLLLFRIGAPDRPLFSDLQDRWSQELPAAYAPDESGGLVRGGETIGDRPHSDAHQRLVSAFNLGIASYMALDYRDAAAQFDTGRPAADRLQRLVRLQPADSMAADDSATAQQLVDYFFFAGMTHLGLAATDAPDLRTHHLNRAIDALRSSLDTATRVDTAATDRSRLYLGIALGMEGDRLSAAEQLSAVSDTSPYFADAKRRLRDLDETR